MTKSSAWGADCTWSHVRNKTPGRSCLYLQWASLSDHRGRVYVNSLLIAAASIKRLQITALCACDAMYVAQSKHCRVFFFTYNEELPLMSRRWSETGQEQKKKKRAGKAKPTKNRMREIRKWASGVVWRRESFLVTLNRRFVLKHSAPLVLLPPPLLPLLCLLCSHGTSPSRWLLRRVRP